MKPNSRAALIAALVAALLLGLLLGLNLRDRGREVPAPPRAAGPAAAGTFPDVYDRVSPAVVSIYAATTAPPAVVMHDTPFGVLLERVPPVRSMSSGSGFFISAEGHIVTNDHVLGRAETVEVVLKEGGRLRARVVGRDPATDLAVLKVDGGRHPFVNFSAAASPRVGEPVIAIGNPFGLGTTATSGIVSAYGRDIGSAYVDFVQLDAPINQGNSGGPTFNARGEVVGVNTAIFSPTGGSVGIGFAIPASTAADVSRQLMARGRVERGFMGAAIGDPTPAAARALGAEDGALVASVVPGGPAARAGLLPGDLIVAVDGDGVSEAAEVIRRVVQAEPGARLRLELMRRGRPLTLALTPERRSS
jgi:serine protease Do